MKFHQLTALVAAADAGSIRAAARHLHLTQAALTKALRQLEEDAGTALLTRGSKGIVLTEAGERLRVRAQAITHQLEQARDELDQHRGEDRGSVRVALTPYLMLTVLGEAFRWFRKQHPGVQLRVHEGLVARTLTGLREGRIDLAVVADTGDVPDGEFRTTPLHREHQALVVRRGHPVLEQLQARALHSLEWVLPGTETPGLDPGLARMFERAGLQPPAQITRCDALAAMGLVRQSDAVSVMPVPLLGLPECRQLVAVPLRSLRPPPLNLVLITPAHVPLTPAQAHLARCLQDAIAAARQTR